MAERRNRLREKQPAWSLHEVSRREKDSVMEFFDVHKKGPRIVFYKANLMLSSLRMMGLLVLELLFVTLMVILLQL